MKLGDNKFSIVVGLGALVLSILMFVFFNAGQESAKESTQVSGEVGQVSVPQGAESESEQKPTKSVKPATKSESVFKAIVNSITVSQELPFVLLSGVSNADKTVTIIARTSGEVVSVMEAKKGSFVGKDEPIIQLNPESKTTQYKSALAFLKVKETMYKGRYELYKEGYLSKVELESARAELDSAKAQVENAKNELSKATINAPEAGILNDITIDKGQYARATQEVGQLLVVDPIVVDTGVGENYINYLKMNDPVEVTLNNGKVFQGSISYLSFASNLTTGSYKVQIKINNPEYYIKIGQTLQIKVPVNPGRVFKVKKSALGLGANNNLGIKIIDSEGFVRFKSVKMVSDTDDSAFIQSDELSDNFKMIVIGQDYAQLDSKIEYIEQ